MRVLGIALLVAMLLSGTALAGGGHGGHHSPVPTPTPCLCEDNELDNEWGVGVDIYYDINKNNAIGIESRLDLNNDDRFATYAVYQVRFGNGGE